MVSMTRMLAFTPDHRRKNPGARGFVVASRQMAATRRTTNRLAKVKKVSITLKFEEFAATNNAIHSNFRHVICLQCAYKEGQEGVDYTEKSFMRYLLESVYTETTAFV